MKEGADERWSRLNVCQVRLNAAPERLVSAQWRLAYALALEVIPHELVGIQLRRIARKEMQFQTADQTLNQ
jgi:hypothetical protein